MRAETRDHSTSAHNFLTASPRPAENSGGKERASQQASANTLGPPGKSCQRRRALPAEFAIDILLRVASANNVDKKWKQEILAEAFILTSGVQNEVRLKGKPRTPVDSRVNYRSYAFDLNLDALSLRSKIISQMLLLDKGQALRMLNQIPTNLRLPALSCSDQMVYNVDELYKMLGSVTGAVYTERKVQQGERVQFLLPYVKGLTSPAQIAALIRMIAALRLTEKELFMVSQAFASALKQVCRRSLVHRGVDGIQDGAVRVGFHSSVEERRRCL